MSQQYDASPEEQRLAQEKLERKLYLRNLFLKEKTDPFKHASESGTVFDSAFLKYQAMNADRYRFFKPTPKSVMTGVFGLILPMFGFGFLLYNDRSKRETAYRNGEVAYKDREFKFQG